MAGARTSGRRGEVPADGSPIPTDAKVPVAPHIPTGSRQGGPQRGLARGPLDAFFFRPEEGAGEAPEASTDLAGGPLATEETVREFLVLVVSGEDYAVPIDRLREIVRDPVLTEVPRAPAYVLGMMMLRGEAVPVFDLRLLLGLAPVATPARTARTLIVDVGEGPCGLHVDRVRQVVRVRASSIEPPPPGVGGPDPDLVAGIARVQDRIAVVLDLVRVLDRRSAG